MSTRTQAERRAESERRILDAAAALLVERGIEGTSLAEIGKRAGYSHGLVHLRFGSKDALIERLYDESIVLYSDAITGRLQGLNGLQALRTVAQTYFELLGAQNPLGRLHLILGIEAIAGLSATRPLRAEWELRFRESIGALVSSGIADGSIRDDVPVEAAAVAIVGLLRGVALEGLVDPGAVPVTGGGSVVTDHLDAYFAAV